MIDPGRSVASWIGGRAILYLLALLCLIVVDISRDENSLIRAKLSAFVPDKDFVQHLESGHKEIEADIENRYKEANAWLSFAHVRTQSQLEDRLKSLDKQIADRNAKQVSLSPWNLATLTGRDLTAHVRNKMELQL